MKQIAVWRTIVLEYFHATKQYILNVNDAARNPPFKNTEINRKLDVEFILAILSDLQRTQNAAPRDGQRNSWDIYWHTLDEWAAMIYSYVSSKGMLNAVLTLFELTQGDDTTDEGMYLFVE